jgi:FkbM family methyltransferase
VIDVREARDVPAADVPLPWLLGCLTDIPWPAKRWIAERPLAWRYYAAACRRAGWNGGLLGWHTPRNGPFAGIRTRALHANHLWVPVGVYEVGVSRYLMAALRERAPAAADADVWDVGANHGRLSLLCARHGASRVLAIEPLASNIAMLHEYMAANPAISARIDVLQAAVADEDGEVEFVSNDRDGAVGQIRSREVATYDYSGSTSIARVASWRLDTLRASRRAPALVKIDVEGAEVLVLRGAARLLAADRPIVLVEIHNADAGRASLELLRNAGYRCERLDAGGRPAPIGDEFAYGHVLARADH